ncbi:MAG TPA: beta galactosidase jelly roll domain-containing protein, partial [Verrucomicrobiae bacterium]
MKNPISLFIFNSTLVPATLLPLFLAAAPLLGRGADLAPFGADAKGSPEAKLVGATYTDESWKQRRLDISLKGDWHFATDSGEEGISEKWYANDYNDSTWQVLKSGLSWQEQGVSHHGFGWYRQKILVPKGYTGVPLKLTLTKIPSDDDVWFNGVHIGGWSGEYKYDNQILRSYTVPASLINYDGPNAIALRIWGGNLTFIGDKSGLIAGPLVAELDPYTVEMRQPDGPEVPAELFDLSGAQQGKPFEIIFRFPPELASAGAQLSYRLTDYKNGQIASGASPLVSGPDHASRAVVQINRETAQTIYLRGRFQAKLAIKDASGHQVYSGNWKLDKPAYPARDNDPLPALPETIEDTPYGRLKLVDDIDCSQSLFDEIHPYLQSGFDAGQLRETPGSDVAVKISDILGKQARESENGWFAYRIGRGTLTPHTTYLIRIEYPEDKPRYCPIEIQAGQNFMDVGWENGVGANDVYDNWPLSHQWQWYDVIVPLDDKTVGTGGTGSASATNGVWIYFMNKIKPNSLFSMWSGGPAVAHIKLYEIDPAKNSPVIQSPQGLPHRVLSFDWERQPDSHPEDLVRYAKLMGYSAISPVIIKWAFANYSDPLNGYDSIIVDSHNYWTSKKYDPAQGEAVSPIPGIKSQHERFL